MRRSTVAMSAALSLAALLAAPVDRPVAAQSRTVWSSTMNMTTDSGNGKRPASFAMKTQVSDRYFRTEIVQVSGTTDGSDIAEGMYMIFDGKDSTMTTVMPSQRMATVMGLGMVMGQAREMQVSTRPSLTSQIADLGDGGRMLGHATHKYRVVTSGTMEVSMMGHVCTRPMNSVSEMWVAPDVDLRESLDAAQRHFGPAAKLGGPSVDATVTMPKGTPLRSVVHATDRGPDGTTRTVTTTLEYVEITKGLERPTDFTVPPGFKVMDMRAMMAKMPAGMLDSAMVSASDAALSRMC